MSAETATSVDIDDLRQRKFGSYTHSFTSRDLCLYALGLGCKPTKDLQYVYEGHPQFQALPTYCIIAAHPAMALIPLETYIPGFDRTRALHGEQFLRLLSPLPAHGKLVTRAQLTDVRDKGKGKGVVTHVRTVTTDTLTGRDVAEAEFVGFALGAGGFGSPWPPAPRPPGAELDCTPPSRPPDVVLDCPTHPDQAALYRLSGDLNPLHIDAAQAAAIGGFPQPILHGLCSMGMAVKAVVDACAQGDQSRLRSVKVRFSKHVFPGDTLTVRMWRVGGAAGQSNAAAGANPSAPQRVIFEASVVSRNALVLTSAAVELGEAPLASKL